MKSIFVTILLVAATSSTATEIKGVGDQELKQMAAFEKAQADDAKLSAAKIEMLARKKKVERRDEK